MALKDPLDRYHDYRVHVLNEKGYKVLFTVDQMDNTIIDATLETAHGYIIKCTQLPIIRRRSFKETLNDIRKQVKDKLWTECINVSIRNGR